LRERCRAIDERASELDARVDELEARRSTAEAHLEKSRLDPEPAKLRERVRAAEERLRASEERHHASEERALSAEARLRAADERVRVSDERVRVSDEHARSTEERARKLEALALSAAHEEERARKLEALVLSAAQEREAAQELEAESAKLEAQLRDRGREIQELRAEVDRRDKLVRELVMTNFPPHPSPSDLATEAKENGSEASANGFADNGPPSSGETEIASGSHAPAMVADLSARLDRLASDAARREADLVGARWRIAQLERELTQQR
jgi:chromosome segregation ATPase